MVKNPPPELVESEFVLVPDFDGSVYSVNVDAALEEPFPYFPINTAVRFELFTVSNPTEPQLITHRDEATLSNSNFDPNRPTRIFIHGWNSQGLLTPRFAEAYFQKGGHDVNFIAVNWRAGSDTINYVGARRRVNVVGPYVAHFIDFLVDRGNLDLENLIVIGHSLGAHIAGIAGKNVASGQLSHIIGLDPASPLFQYRNVDTRLANTDAKFVEVIHTSAGSLGFSEPLGNASFYPNGGRSQPGCGWDMTGGCAHARAYEFYIESIFSNIHFFGVQCSSLRDVRRGRCEVVKELVQLGGEPGTTK